MAMNKSRGQQQRERMSSPAAAWTDGWRMHVDCWGYDCAKGRYRIMRELVQRFPDDTLGQLAGRAWCRGCRARPDRVWLVRPAMKNRLAERIALIGGTE